MAGTDTTPDPKQAELIEAQLRLYRVQARWETPKALAAILLAAAAIAASGRLADLLAPPRPQNITVHLDAPLTLGGH
jgi:hypothetical protein